MRTSTPLNGANLLQLYAFSVSPLPIR
uniref:Uncharacterized protein n=1 Tax=Anguilla anguilla TaxID=7936 RepID=A0A0E9W7X8_ANGAN